jgi:hypothetical protein
VNKILVLEAGYIYQVIFTRSHAYVVTAAGNHAALRVDLHITEADYPPAIENAAAQEDTYASQEFTHAKRLTI